MKKIVSLLFAFSFLCSRMNAQENNPLFSRLQAIANDAVTFYNIDGIEITSQTISGDFTKKNIAKKFKKYAIRETDLTQSEASIGNQNFYVAKTDTAAPGMIQHTSYYFVETPNGIKAITFVSVNKTVTPLEKELVPLIIANNIPSSVYTSLKTDSINFAGRKIALGSSCGWRGVNNIQCPNYGQMNWSIHQSLDDALASIENQYKMIQAKKQGKIVSEEEVSVVFEGAEVKAKKAVYDFKGVTSLLVGMSGGKTLTIYFVAAPVRQNFVSCVMSFWNNDVINPSGLAPLLEEVMQLKN
jgi:hypothetical protein